MCSIGDLNSTIALVKRFAKNGEQVLVQSSLDLPSNYIAGKLSISENNAVHVKQLGSRFESYEQGLTYVNVWWVSPKL